MQALSRIMLIVPCLGLAQAISLADEPAAATRPAVETALPELRPILSDDARRDLARQLIDRFVAHVNGSENIPAAAKEAVASGWEEHRADDEPQDFLAASLAIASPAFREAFTALEEEEYAAADQALKPLLDDPDPYLSLNARVLAARSLVEQEKLEEAEALLTPLAADEEALIARSFSEAEVDFLLGYTQLSNLHYDKAQASLERFEREHPDAPERFRLPARQMLQELMVRRPEELGEVSDLMVYAGRRLRTGHPGEPVLIKQDRAIELLSKLIRKAEEQEQQNSGGGGGGNGGQGNQPGGGGTPQGTGRPGSPAGKSALPGGEGRTGDLHRSPNARPGDEWGKMRPEDREKILQSLRKSFPSRYRQLVEQYYKQLAREE